MSCKYGYLGGKALPFPQFKATVNTWISDLIKTDMTTPPTLKL